MAACRLIWQLFIDAKAQRFEDDLVVDAHAGDEQCKSEHVKAVEDLPANDEAEEPDE